MEIRIKKLRGQAQIVWGKNGPFDIRRGNSAMTKDLIKEEMRVRVLSFRPTLMDECLYKAKTNIKKGIDAQNRLIWDSSPEKLNGFLKEASLKNLIPSADKK